MQNGCALLQQAQKSDVTYNLTSLKKKAKKYRRTTHNIKKHAEKEKYCSGLLEKEIRGVHSFFFTVREGIIDIHISRTLTGCVGVHTQCACLLGCIFIMAIYEAVLPGLQKYQKPAIYQ
jgi:hypothetical protein